MSASWGLFVWDIKPRQSNKPIVRTCELQGCNVTIESPLHFCTPEHYWEWYESDGTPRPVFKQECDDYALLRAAISSADHNRRHESFGSR